MDQNATILRVKRKRGTDPADALLLACKRIRPETSQSVGETVPEPREAEVENSVFKLVATVATQVRGPPLATKLLLANVNAAVQVYIILFCQEKLFNVIHQIK